ncbi:MAG: 1-acyl-sn-glycerol-3-phosphate acyltransferase [Leptonema sp. (in: bacteria)]
MTENLFSLDFIKESFIKNFNRLFYKEIPHKFLENLYEYTNPDILGLENIPKEDPVLVVPNHSGVLAIDAMVLQYIILKKVKRFPYTMSHNFWHQNPFFKYSSEKLGYIPQDFKMAVKLLKEKKLMVIFPEAEEGNFKPSLYMYKLQNFNPGFISLAILTNAKIIPTCIIGAEEANINLGYITLKNSNTKIPLPLNLIPFPVKWKIIFLKAMDLSKYTKSDAKNIEFLQEAAQIVKMKIQHRIHNELLKRGILKFLVDG